MSESEVLVAQSCPTLCDPVDLSPPGSSVPGILHARILWWVAIMSSYYRKGRSTVCHQSLIIRGKEK